MKNTIIFIIVLIVSLDYYAQSRRDMDIQEIVAEIDRITLMNYVKDLDSFNSRFMLSANRYEVVNYLFSKLRYMWGFHIALDTIRCYSDTSYASFDLNNMTNFGEDGKTEQINIIATLRGNETPDDIYIICGHYDSFAFPDPIQNAPGADDNASGVACLLEIARAMMRIRYQPKSTIKFICFAANELCTFQLGESGARLFAREAQREGDNIKAVLNLDQVGFTSKQLTESVLNVTPNEYFSGINQILDICQTYGGLIYRPDGRVRGDLQEFSDNGYPGIMFEESDIMDQRNVLTSNDRWYTLNDLYLTEVARAAAAVLISLEDGLTDNEEYDVDYSFALEQNYPNPFNPTTTISYSIPQPGNVSIIVYDLLGREVEVLENEYKQTGNYKVTFNASGLTSGTYYYVLSTNGNYRAKKLVLLK